MASTFNSITSIGSRDSEGQLHYSCPELAFPVEKTSGLSIFGQVIDYSLFSRTSVISQVLDFYCIVHVVSGSAWYWGDGGRSVAKSGQAIFVTSQTQFDFAAANTGAVIDLICFTGPLADFFKSSDLLLNGVFPFGQARRLLPLIEHSTGDSVDDHIRASSLCMSLITELYFSRQKAEVDGETSKIDELIQLIELNPEKWWDCRQMAEFCNISEVQLRRLFKKEVGLSPKVFVDKIKIEHAADLLKKDFSVKIVSELLGYSDQFHFSRRFKSIMGLSPRDYLSQY